MAVNEVIVNGETIVNLKSDTVTPKTLANGATAHNASGEEIIGLMPTVSAEEWQNVVNTAQNASAKANELEERLAKKQNSIYYITGDSTTAGVWTGTCPDITEYYDGLMIAYKTNVAGATDLTLNINGLGAVSVVRNATTAVTTHYAANSILMLTYTVDSGTAYWKISDYDSDTKTRSSNKANSKMYIIGASTQSTSGQTTYSNSKCYIGADNCLYSNGEKVQSIEEINALIDTKLGVIENGSY